MTNEILMATTLGLLPISAINLYYAIEFHYNRRNNLTDQAMSCLVWGLFCWQMAIFSQSVLYLLWDWELIYRSTQLKLVIIPRCFFLVGSIYFFQGLNIDQGPRFTAAVVGMIIATVIVSFCLGVAL